MIYFYSQVINNIYIYDLNQLYIEFVEYNKEKYETVNELLQQYENNIINLIEIFKKINAKKFINIYKF